MAKLVKCKACGEVVSKNANSCPKCGEPLKRKPLGCGTAIVIIVVGAAIGFSFLDNQTSVNTSNVNAAKISADCSAQDERQEIINKLIADDYWQKVERPASLYHIYAMPKFTDNLTFDDKKNFVSVVSAYSICTGGEVSVIIYNAINGKKIGSFSEYGLDLN